MDVITQFTEEQTVKGDLARLLLGIVESYQAGTITLEEKNDQVITAVANFTLEIMARDNEQPKWAVLAATIAVGIV